MFQTQRNLSFEGRQRKHRAYPGYTTGHISDGERRISSFQNIYRGVLLPIKARWLTNHPSDLTYFVFIVFLAINCHVVKDVSITYYILTLKLKCVEHFLLRIFIKSNNDRDQLAVCSFSFNIAKITGF